MKSRGWTLLLVLALAACGGGGTKNHNSAKFDNATLAVDVAAKLGAKATLVCASKTGYLSGYFRHSYNRVCGVRRDQPTVFVSLDVKEQTWCVVSPRFARACPQGKKPPA